MFGTEDDNEGDKVVDKDVDSTAGKVILIVLFFPALLVGMVYYSFFRFLRFRPSVIASIVAVTQVLILIYFLFGNAFGKLIKGITDYQHLSTNWPNLVAPLMFSAIFLGGFIGLAIVGWEVREMRRNPHRRELPGTWMYQFEFRRTPLELWKKKRLIKALKQGDFVDSEKSPLGLNEEGRYAVVSRYLSEANKHTLIVGNSGSGKPLLGTTEVPTPKGFVPLKDLVIGDEVYDENGKPIKVVACFNPVVTKAYKMHFRNAFPIVSGSDHLWAVIEYTEDGNLNDRVLLTTEAIAEGIHSGSKFLIEGLTSAVKGTEPAPLIDCYKLGRWLFTRGNNNAFPGSQELRQKLGLDNGKRIPEVYYFTSFEDRFRLLAGIIDSSYCKVYKEKVVLTHKSSELLTSVKTLVASLGWRVSSVESLSFPGAEYILEFILDKDFVWDSNRTNNGISSWDTLGEYAHYIDGIEVVKAPADAFHCITVEEGSRLFLVTRDFIPTHNTITMQSLILNDIENGIPLILIDMKRSPEFASKLSSWTRDAGGSFYHFVNGDESNYDVPNSSGQCFYDPLKSGSATSKADMVLGMREYDTASAVYKNNMQQLLQVVFAMLKNADKTKAKSIDWTHGGICQLASAVADNNIIELAGACEGTPVQAAALAISDEARGKTGIKHAIGELQGQMRTIMTSEYGQWLKLDHEHPEKNIDLFAMTQKPGTVILFSLNSDAEPDFAKFIGSMIMADLTATSARRRNNQMTNQVNVYIDEFQAINPSSVAGLLEKSRESRIALTLAQQSFEQIVASTQNNGEAYLLSILDTCSNFIVHAGSTEDSAERLSKILGKEWVDTYRASNKNKSFFLSMNWANKRNQTVQTSKEEKWKFEPAKFMALSSPDKNNDFKATAVMVNKTCSDPLFKGVKGAVARTIWMLPADKVLEKYYTPTFIDEGGENGLQRRIIEEDSQKLTEYDKLTVGTVLREKELAEAAAAEEEAQEGGFNWEEIPDPLEDEELDFSSNAFLKVDLDAPTTSEVMLPPKPVIPQTSTFLQYKSGVKTIEPTAINKPKENGFPKKPNTPPTSAVSKETPDEEIALPSLEDLY